MAEDVVKKIINAVPIFLDIAKKFHVNYDAKADVLYISFEHPQKADDTKVTDNGILLRYRNDKLVGITILNASRFKR